MQSNGSDTCLSSTECERSYVRSKTEEYVASSSKRRIFKDMKLSFYDAYRPKYDDHKDAFESDWSSETDSCFDSSQSSDSWWGLPYHHNLYSQLKWHLQSRILLEIALLSEATDYGWLVKN